MSIVLAAAGLASAQQIQLSASQQTESSNGQTAVSAKLEWRLSGGADLPYLYTIERSEDGGGGYTAVSSQTGRTGWLDPHLAAGKTYHYRVRILNLKVTSNTVSVTVSQ